jgi:Transposase DDE domain group 1
MGEKHHESFQLSFNSSLRVDFRGSRVTSDGGPIVVRELDEWLGMGALIERYLTDTRRGRNTQLPLADLLRQSVYSRLAGYEDVNDAERVSADPTFRLIGSEKIWGKRSPGVPSYAAGRMPCSMSAGVGSKDGAGCPQSAASQAAVT